MKVRTEGTREARPQVSCTRISLLAGKAVKGSKSGSWRVLAGALGLRMEVRVVLKQERVRDSSHVLTKCQSPGLLPLAVISFLLPPSEQLCPFHTWRRQPWLGPREALAIGSPPLPGWEQLSPQARAKAGVGCSVLCFGKESASP